MNRSKLFVSRPLSIYFHISYYKYQILARWPILLDSPSNFSKLWLKEMFVSNRNSRPKVGTNQYDTPWTLYSLHIFIKVDLVPSGLFTKSKRSNDRWSACVVTPSYFMCGNLESLERWGKQWSPSDNSYWRWSNQVHFGKVDGRPQWTTLGLEEREVMRISRRPWRSTVPQYNTLQYAFVLQYFTFVFCVEKD